MLFEIKYLSSILYLLKNVLIKRQEQAKALEKKAKKFCQSATNDYYISHKMSKCRDRIKAYKNELAKAKLYCSFYVYLIIV